MKTDPLHDADRLSEIARLDIFAPEVRTMLQAYTEEAALRLGLPLGLVTVVFNEVQYFAASHGLPDGWMKEVQGTPVEWSFCRFAVEGNCSLVIEDATRDRRTQNNPLVAIDHVRCYAGAPLRTSAGHTLGTLCVAGVDVHEFQQDDIEVLQSLAREVVEKLEARAASEA
ncbi:MAG: GAF domain-containing protein [Verrucomicrobiota bacterium JB022]|nr:GAF domain-containing protein [Verrucomicrobiota bacterium JB022]